MSVNYEKVAQVVQTPDSVSPSGVMSNVMQQSIESEMQCIYIDIYYLSKNIILLRTVKG